MIIVGRMKIGICVGVVVALGGVAHAEVEDFQPSEHWVSTVEAAWMPYGTMLYSGNQGEISFDSDTAWALGGSVGYEMDGGFELGFTTRVIANEKLTCCDFRATELIVGPKLTFHVHPVRELDVQFVVAPDYSHVFFPSDASWPDPSGLTVDFAGTLGYSLGGRLWALGTLGYQRGFQHTTEMSEATPLHPMPMELDTNFATDYAYLAAGVAYRF